MTTYKIVFISNFQCQLPASKWRLWLGNHQRHLQQRQRPVWVPGQRGGHWSSSPQKVHWAYRPSPTVQALHLSSVCHCCGRKTDEPDLLVSWRVPSTSDQLVQHWKRRPDAGCQCHPRKEQGWTHQVDTDCNADQGWWRRLLPMRRVEQGTQTRTEIDCRDQAVCQLWVVYHLVKICNG